jgi:hypothetical protein
MFAIRDDREYVSQEDLTKAARKVGEAKKHESEDCLTTSNSFDALQRFDSQDGIFDVDSLHTVSVLFASFYWHSNCKMRNILLVLPENNAKKGKEIHNLTSVYYM